MPTTGSIEWAEDLPPNCPPNDCYFPTGNVYYRATDTFPPTERDFFSVRKLNPNEKYRINECQALSLSVFDDVQVCIDALKFPTLKDKKFIVAVELCEQSGVIYKTGRRSHYSWWMFRSYNPIPDCKKAWGE